MKELTVTFVVSSESSEKLRLARQLAASKARPDSLLTEVARSKDKVYTQTYRLRDYFSSVSVADAGPTSFRLVFVPHHGADRYWKDLVVSILTSISYDCGVLIESAKQV